jgi:hypothetical protein
VHHSFFADVSLSTIKRAVGELKDKKLLIPTGLNYTSEDKRVSWLTVNRGS